MSIVMPDFKEWAKHLISQPDAAIALEQAFQQGYHFGYQKGKNIGWQDAWDAEYADMDKPE